MHPILFAAYVWEHLLLYGQWSDHNGTLIGAITLSVLVAIGLTLYVRRERLQGLFGWIRANPVKTAFGATPLSAFAILSLAKYLTFMSAVATTIGVLVALENNNRTHSREARKSAREAKSARAALALELSALIDYCRAYIAALNQVRTMSIGSDADGKPVFYVELNKDVKFPEVPPTTVATLKEIIKAADDDALADRCMQVLTYVQYVKGFAGVFYEFGAVTIDDNINHAKLRATILYSLISTMFDFARGESDSIHAVTWETAHNAALSMSLSPSHSFDEYFLLHQHHKNPLDILAK